MSRARASTVLRHRDPPPALTESPSSALTAPVGLTPSAGEFETAGEAWEGEDEEECSVDGCFEPVSEGEMCVQHALELGDDGGGKLQSMCFGKFARFKFARCSHRLVSWRRYINAKERELFHLCRRVRGC